MKRGGNMQEFSILDPKGMNTIAFAVESDYVENEEVYTLKMLDSEKDDKDGKVEKTFFVELDPKDSVTIIMLTIGKSKMIMNTGLLQDSELDITEDADIIKYEPIINNEGVYQYRDFKYTPNLKRPISIIDSVTCEEVKPMLYLDPDTGEITGKCKMQPYRQYFAIEITK
ncbi:MAG: hypothetical protein E7311_03590 [Clostridiales bacterium]|nr:hypothetical protein [Clostridiales bacterium]